MYYYGACNFDSRNNAMTSHHQLLFHNINQSIPPHPPPPPRSSQSNSSWSILRDFNHRFLPPIELHLPLNHPTGCLGPEGGVQNKAVS
ncbi:hypothetical protein BO70DRAFT_122776 [Aspergillus heteromorphus CBS 117.55]|uniref:Uncharacterized protein n=1 Tax=Aspergillus heteromorphus CBS 117.55 TaxID=1448321 RepID=A0A317VER0_9EURO|nr:uncharacterized protein BO70DRAFT_122776 [Aspergillus heteromorphus CBS 117.55]PWY71442.1 hypothetical protein BO70DRAFT_122776 [Aspergillus heteromorphus CBS 117.55]